MFKSPFLIKRRLYEFFCKYFFGFIKILFWIKSIKLIGGRAEGYKISDDTGTLYFQNIYRSRLYFYGIENRFKNLREAYLTDQCSLIPGDVLIDCGANIGEFSLACHRHYNVECFAIEPSPAPFEALSKNVAGIKGITVLNAGLGVGDGVATLFDKSSTADSSFIDPGGAKPVSVEMVTGRSLLDRFSIENVKLLKVEAEGYEPEVLSGFLGVLERIQYVVVEMSGERGISQDFTICPCVNFLVANGFEMKQFSPGRYTALFANRSFGVH